MSDTLKDALVVAVETAASSELSPATQQATAEIAGELKRGYVHGPNKTLIPTFYNTRDNAFVPVYAE